VADLLPQEVLSRPEQGFGTPMQEWLRGDFGRRTQQAIRSFSLADRDLLDHDEIDRLSAAHRVGRGNWQKQLWNVYNLSLWRWIAADTHTTSV
jgi:asparagine synthase (glutamine-hydrolysing)